LKQCQQISTSKIKIKIKLKTYEFGFESKNIAAETDMIVCEIESAMMIN
jgi:hypothetical protein